jgi:hypothetical protein
MTRDTEYLNLLCKYIEAGIVPEIAKRMARDAVYRSDNLAEQRDRDEERREGWSDGYERV